MRSERFQSAADDRAPTRGFCSRILDHRKEKPRSCGRCGDFAAVTIERRGWARQPPSRSPPRRLSLKTSRSDCHDPASRAGRQNRTRSPAPRKDLPPSRDACPRSRCRQAPSALPAGLGDPRAAQTISCFLATRRTWRICRFLAPSSRPGAVRRRARQTSASTQAEASGRPMSAWVLALPRDRANCREFDRPARRRTGSPAPSVAPPRSIPRITRRAKKSPPPLECPTYARSSVPLVPASHT